MKTIKSFTKQDWAIIMVITAWFTGVLYIAFNFSSN